ncbi:MAG TPA: thiamine pyrophosphate-dependent enzyme [Myxococcales bacterium]|jgi:indolepyruvate ferredoxin oxidoreductase alpha subunit
MATLKDRLVDPAGWSDLVMGNWAVARAMIDSGTRVVTSYPGSPTPEIASALELVPEEKRSYRFDFAANEKVALEVAAGAALNGHPAAVFFKSVGLNVAADSLIQLPLLHLAGGLVVILGDDPGANSSQNEQDNRVFARMAYLPMFEPATPQEAYDLYREAAALARKLAMPVLLRLTTHVCHARELVTVQPCASAPPDWTPRFDPTTHGPYVPITRSVFPMKRRALERLESVREVAESAGCNRVLAPNGAAPVAGKRLGIVSSALPAMAALEVLHDGGQPVEILKLGLSHPLPRKKIAEFLASHDEVLVLEELDRVMETEIKSLAWDSGSKAVLRARTDREELMGELGPQRVRALLARTWPEAFSPGPPTAAPAGEPDAVPRLPQMCPGCGHRSAFHAVKAALEKDSITVADIGCHTLGFQAPYEIGQVLLCMGHGVSTASGLSIGNPARKVVAFIGDSTLMHAGLPGILDAAAHDRDIVLVVLDNGTTAMTGHQKRLGSGEDGGAKVPLKPLFEALGVKFLRECDAYAQAQLTAHVKEAMAHPGFAVVVARHPCMLKLTRDQKRKNPAYQTRPVAIDQGRCDQRHTCVAEFGCPSFVRGADGSVTVHPDLCIGDGSCLQTCPVEAIVRPQRPGGAS